MRYAATASLLAALATATGCHRGPVLIAGTIEPPQEIALMDAANYDCCAAKCDLVVNGKFIDVKDTFDLSANDVVQFVCWPVIRRHDGGY